MIGRLWSKVSAQWLIVLLVGAISTEAIAAPSVAGVSGTVTQGSTLTIAGSSFGTNSLHQEWTGAAIEAGSDGSLFSKTGWSHMNDWSPVNYATDQLHSGSKSLKVVIDPANNWNGLFVYALPDAVNTSDTFYLTWWARYVGQATNLQWKMLRLSGNDTIVDGSQEMVFFNWQPSSASGPQLVIDPGTGNDQTFFPPANVYVTQGGTWYREEVLVTASAAGSRNGSTTVNRYGGGAFNTFTTPALLTHTASGNTYSFIEFQNYFGNGAAGSPTVWFDDIFITNGFSRVEVCDTSTWTARTHCEVQVPTAWSSSVITISGNPGSFPNGTAYLYVLDASGNVNASGHPVTIGSGGGDITAPSVPTNLRVVSVVTNAVTLAWDASTDDTAVTGYFVEHCAGVSCAGFIQVGSPVSLTFNDSGILTNTSYSFRVRATDAASNVSSYSSTLTQATDTVKFELTFKFRRVVSEIREFFHSFFSPWMQMAANQGGLS